jgi:hypothetical protein
MAAECRHILPRGTKCHAIALRGKFYCYYHQQLHTYRQDGARDDRAPLALPSIEDASGIQLAVMQIMGAIATRRIDPREAGALLYSLQIAIQALDRIPATPPEEIVEMTYCDGIGADIGVEQSRCEPHPACATCTTIECINVARQNKQSTRQVLDAERAQREIPAVTATDLIAIEPVANPLPILAAPAPRNLPEPATEFSLEPIGPNSPQPQSIQPNSIPKARIDKFRPHEPTAPEPDLDRKALDCLARQLRAESDHAAQSPGRSPVPEACQPT